ncbi:MAG: hypothetical protein U0840_03920 [Gemmataceae bacterium]
MAAHDLITRARAYQALPVSSGIDTLVDTLLSACSRAIQKYCRRAFYVRTIEELHHGGQPILVLRDYPVQSIVWLRGNPTTVLTLSNTSASNQRATVSITSTGLSLTRVASGVSTTDTSVTFASNATLSAVATAVNALGNGWSARVASDFGLWASADLYISPDLGDGVQAQGALNAANNAQAALKLHVDEYSDYTWTSRGSIFREPDLRWDDQRDGSFWPGGANYYRVKYTAGFTTIPEDVQEACASWVSHCYHRTLHDPGHVGSFPSGGDAENWFPPLSPPPVVAGLLAPYRKHSV